MINLVRAATLFAIALSLACGGDGDNAKKADGSTLAGQSGEGDIGISSSGRTTEIISGGFTGVEADALASGSSLLPGITVIGYGDATAEPDAVLIRLTIGKGDIGSFSGDSIRLDLIEEEELQPVVDALKGQGVEEDAISVSTLTNSPYGVFSGSSAEIAFRWSKPKEFRSILDIAEDTIRQETNQGLQNVEALFTVSECEPLEEQAWAAALEDARSRAERVAALADLQLGDIVSISESPGTSIYGVPSGCAAIEELPGVDFSPSAGGNSASEVEVDASLQVTFALR